MQQLRKINTDIGGFHGRHGGMMLERMQQYGTKGENQRENTGAYHENGH